MYLFTACKQYPFYCPDGHWKCHDIRNNPRCLQAEQVCDGNKDCTYDGSDELDCKDHECVAGFIKCADDKCVQVGATTVLTYITTAVHFVFHEARFLFRFVLL